MRMYTITHTHLRMYTRTHEKEGEKEVGGILGGGGWEDSGAIVGTMGRGRVQGEEKRRQGMSDMRGRGRVRGGCEDNLFED
jgi:hypothetical protein